VAIQGFGTARGGLPYEECDAVVVFPISLDWGAICEDARFLGLDGAFLSWSRCQAAQRTHLDCIRPTLAEWWAPKTSVLLLPVSKPPVGEKELLLRGARRREEERIEHLRGRGYQIRDIRLGPGAPTQAPALAMRELVELLVDRHGCISSHVIVWLHGGGAAVYAARFPADAVDGLLAASMVGNSGAVEKRVVRCVMKVCTERGIELLNTAKKPPKLVEHQRLPGGKFWEFGETRPDAWSEFCAELHDQWNRSR